MSCKDVLTTAIENVLSFDNNETVAANAMKDCSGVSVSLSDILHNIKFKPQSCDSNVNRIEPGRQVSGFETIHAPRISAHSICSPELRTNSTNNEKMLTLITEVERILTLDLSPQ